MRTNKKRRKGQIGDLKLEAQQVKEFDGNLVMWQKWKSKTECAFDGSGYEKNLSSLPYAESNKKRNNIVYSQFSAATVDGTAHHLVKKLSESKDGYAAWQALTNWYNRDQIKHETAEDIGSKVDGLTLHSVITASNYVNKFFTWNTDLSKFQEKVIYPGR